MIKFDADSLVAGIKDMTDKLGEALGEQTLRRVGFAGAEVFREEAKVNATKHKKKTGTLMNNIIVKRLTEESDGGNKQAYLVTVRAGKMNQDGDAFYWRFVEDGHKFVPRNKRRGKGANWKAHRAAAEAEYGTATVPAYPFMRPAYESKKEAAVKAMTEKMGEEVKRVLGGGS